jgi:hypothetical protein
MEPSHRRQRIFVPQRQVQGGFDFKFETDSYNVKLYGLLTAEQYAGATEKLNDTLKPSRSGKADGVLLAAGPLLVPLAIWGIRHRNQTRRRKRLLKVAIKDFNNQYPSLLMRWNRQPESKLTIERKPAEDPPPPPPASGEMANAVFVSDLLAYSEPIPGRGSAADATGHAVV